MNKEEKEGKAAAAANVRAYARKAPKNGAKTVPDSTCDKDVFSPKVFGIY